jgi:histidinol dehydrogenase
MKILRTSDPGFSRSWKKWNRRFASDPKVCSVVSGIIGEIQKRGDLALCELNEKFGGAALSPKQLPVNASEIAAALASLAPDTRRAILSARTNVAAFARRGLRRTWFRKNAQGARVGERFDPFDRAGIYIPGGSAPLISSAIMTCTLAKTAGVPEIVACTPSDPSGKVHPTLLAALSLCGATEIYRVGGAQAVAAMALGTKTIRPVRKLFGPGSAWVVEAKRQLFGTVAVDLLPGPSEVVVIADESANPAWVAADLLAQAEHGHGSISLLLTDSEKILHQVATEIKTQLSVLSRKHALRESMALSALVFCASMAEAVRLTNEFSPEHTVVMTEAPGNVSASLDSSGAIFLGHMSPVAAGDFLAGPSHELPTGGAGKSFAGLTVDQFQRRTSIVRYDRQSLAKSRAALESLSSAEGLDAHRRSVTIRLE